MPLIPRAFAAAIAAGATSFEAIAIAGGSGEEADAETPPCGVCRQVMAEFCKEDFAVILGNRHKIARHTLGALLPMAFGAAQLEE